MEGASPLTVVVAFEHHLRYDGQQNYPILRAPRLPNLASRMTSIADTYDAMSTVRPYQQPLARAAAFEVLRKRSETFYDPLLVAISSGWSARPIIERCHPERSEGPVCGGRCADVHLSTSRPHWPSLRPG
jgi:hypothetical protein